MKMTYLSDLSSYKPESGTIVQTNSIKQKYNQT